MMQAYRAKVRNGRLVLDEPTDLPEGSEMDLVSADDHVERLRVLAAIEAGLADGAAGRVVEHEDARRTLEDKFGRLPR